MQVLVVDLWVVKAEGETKTWQWVDFLEWVVWAAWVNQDSNLNRTKIKCKDQQQMGQLQMFSEEVNNLITRITIKIAKTKIIDNE